MPDPTRTAPLARHRAPRRLRWPAWLDRAAEYPRVWWTITAVCTAVSLLLLAVMATGGLHPVTDWNGPPNLKPGIPSPTVAAPATDEPTTRPEPPARPSAPSARPKSSAPTPSTVTAPEVSQMPVQPRERRTRTAAPAQPADPAPESTPEPEPETTPEAEPTPDPRPGCQIGGVIYAPGDPGYDECYARVRGRGR